MAYNKDKRRGLYTKKTKGKARSKGQGKQDQTIIENNQLYPYLKKFIEWGAIKGHADSTLQTRERGLSRFITWCDERDLQQPQNITREILESYQKHLYYYRKTNSEPLSHGTQNQLLSPIRLFFKWLAKTHQILYNPASELELPKQQRGLPKALLSVDEVKTILNVVDISSPFGIRDRAILELFYNTGIRRMELINLQVYDIDISRRTLHVRKGKGNKDRFLPVGDNTLTWIQNYLDEVRQILVKSRSEQTLFLTDYGEPLIKID